MTLIPNAPLLSKPLKLRRNEDIYITSQSQFSSLQQPSYQWTIFTCSSTCSNQIPLNNLTQRELFLQSRTLAYGLYQFELLVTTMSVSLTLSIYIEIIDWNIITNLVSFGRLKMKHHFDEVLILNPGKYSIDSNTIIFDSQKWDYIYYCRISDVNNEEFKLFDDSNQNCFSNRLNVNYIWEYDHSMNFSKSSVKILSQSLKINQTYQFLVHMIHHENSSLQATGYLFVEVKNIHSPMIIINCVISPMCSSNSAFEYINPNTQLALTSFCLENCSSIVKMTWNIYQRSINSWILFNQISFYEDQYLFGLNTNNLTITKDFFGENNQIRYWRFEVIYSFQSEIIQDTMDIEINQGPQNGFCTINPLNGPIDTLFTINCSNWIDDDGIKDYSFYGWKNDSSKKMMLGLTTKSISQVRLPTNIDQISSFDLVVQIRDRFDSITESNVLSVGVYTELSTFLDLINHLQDPNDDIHNHSILQFLESADLNTVGQVVSSILYTLNELHDQSLKILVENGISPTSISVTSLANENLTPISNSSNGLILDEYKKELNKHGNAREQLMIYLNNLPISSFDDVKFQSSILSQLTRTTNQLTRKTSILASDKCYQFSQTMKSISSKISFEDIQFLSTHLLQCGANVMTSVNGPLQGRTTILNVDYNRMNEEINNHCNLYDNEDQLVMCYQKQTVDNVQHQISKMISLITSSLNVHLNLNQNLTINTNSIYFSLEKLSIQSLTNRTMKQIHLPLILNLTNSFVLLRSIIEPLAFADNFQIPSNINFSRSISFSILDENGRNLPIKTTFADPIEVIIPRDPNFIIPKMFLQNVTNKNVLFHFHFISLQNNSSLHLEIVSLNTNISYLLIYKFDSKPQLTNSMKNIDGWKLLCHGMGNYFLNNNQTFNHQSITFGIRELNEKEKERFCGNNVSGLPMTDEMVKFSSNYLIRTYLSACFYLDEKNQWQSDGLLVGPLTNHYQTQCLSTHLTTFTSNLIFLPAPINYMRTNYDLSWITIWRNIFYLIIISFLFDGNIHFIKKFNIERIMKKRSFD